MSGSKPPSTHGSPRLARRALLTTAAVLGAVAAPAAAVLGTSSGDAPAADVRPDDDRTDAAGITSSSIVEELQLVRAQAVSQAAEFAEAKAAEEAEQARVIAYAAQVEEAKQAQAIAYAAAVERAKQAEAAAAAAPPTTAAPAPAPAPTPPPAPAPAPTGAGDPNDPASWDRLAQCESGGNWHINTGNGYYGGLQFSLASWRGVGGTGYPHEHSRETQIAMGKRLWQQGGWKHWPACTRSFGWR